MKLLIKNGTVVNPAKNQHEKLHLYVEDGIIKAMTKTLEPHMEATDVEIYDAEGLYVSPGLVDMHTHMREPGQVHKEGFASGTRAAAAGGFTYIATMANTNPVIDSGVIVRDLKKRIEEESLVKIGIIGAITKGLRGKELSDMGEMAQEGVVAFSDDGHYVDSAHMMRRAMEYATMLNKMVIDHAEDTTMTCHGHMNEGNVSHELGIPGRPAVAEDIAVARDLLLAEKTGAHIHIAHMSTKAAVDLVREAKKKGIRATCEVTAQHITFTDEILKNYDPAGKMAPPIRSEDHRLALLEGLRDGTVDAIITDHAPHTPEEKDHPFCCTPNGFTGLETSLAAVVTMALKPGYIDVEQLVRVMSVNPAKLLGIEGGLLEVGRAADITVFDLNHKWVVDRNAFYTKGKVNPFHGMELQGKAMLTVVDGEVIMKDGVVLR